jgi:hypothetical protein
MHPEMVTYSDARIEFSGCASDFESPLPQGKLARKTD